MEPFTSTSSNAARQHPMPNPMPNHDSQREHRRDRARIVLTRPREWFGRFRKLQFTVDGEVVAAVKIGATVEVRVEPGPHELQLQMDWCRSPSLPIVVQAGETLRFRSKSPNAWRALKTVYSQPGSFFELVPDVVEDGDLPGASG